MVVCLEQGADLHMAQLMPLPLTVSCFSKIQLGFTFLVPAHPGSPGKRAVKRVCVCVCVRDSEWQWHQLGCMQVCTSLQTDNHASNTPLSFHRPDALPAAQPTASKHGRYKVHHSNRHKFSEKLDDSVACLDIAASRDLLVCHMLSNHLKLRLFNVLSLSGESQKMLRQLQWTYPSCKVLLPTCPCWRQPVKTKKA